MLSRSINHRPNTNLPSFSVRAAAVVYDIRVSAPDRRGIGIRLSAGADIAGSEALLSL